MKFSILHTSARPDKWMEVYLAWTRAADGNDPHEAGFGTVEYILVCDRRWGFRELPTSTNPNFKAVWNTGRKCYVDGVNIGAAYATGDVLIVNADDQFPCEHWDTELAKAITDTTRGEWGPQHRAYDYVVEVTTNTPAEHDRGILVMPILSRARYEKYGYVLFPAYESMYSDNDFCEMAKRDQCIIDARHLTFSHKHPIFDQSQPWDEAYQAQNRREAYDIGGKILEARRASNFSGVKPVYSQAPKEKPSIVLITPGQNFSQAWVSAYVELIFALAPHLDIKTQMGFSSNVYVTRKLSLETAKTWDKRPDYVLWIDDDQLLSVEGLQHLITDLERCPDLTGVAGWSWCARDVYGDDERHLSFGIFDESGEARRAEYETMQAHDSDLILIAYTGFPAVLMRGSVLDTMTGDDFLPLIGPEYKPWGILGEDASFFHRAHEKGLQFAVDRRVKVPHLKLRCAEPVAVSSLEGAPVQVERTK